MNIEVAITLTLDDGKEMKMTLARAKELHQKLSDIFDSNQLPSPIMPYPVFPDRQYPIITYSDTGTGNAKRYVS